MLGKMINPLLLIYPKRAICQLLTHRGKQDELLKLRGKKMSHCGLDLFKKNLLVFRFLFFYFSRMVAVRL